MQLAGTRPALNCCITATASWRGLCTAAGEGGSADGWHENRKIAWTVLWYSPIFAILNLPERDNLGGLYLPRPRDFDRSSFGKNASLTDRNPNTQFAPEGGVIRPGDQSCSHRAETHYGNIEFDLGWRYQFMYPLGVGELSRSLKDADRGVFSKLSRQVEIYQSPCTVVVRKW